MNTAPMNPRQPMEGQDHRGSLVRVASILLKAGISATPYGIAGVATLETFQAIRDHLLETKKERDLTRASMFIEGLIGGQKSEDCVNNFLEKLVDPEDFYILFRNALQDDEDRKAPHYAELLRKIALGSVTGDFKAYMIKVAKELTMREISLLAELLVVKEFDVIPVQGPSLDARRLLKRTDLIDRIYQANLLGLSLIEEKNGVLQPTELADKAARALHRKEEIAPQYFGYETWRDERALILIAQHAGAEKLAMVIQQALRRCRVYSNIVYLNGALDLSQASMLCRLLIVSASASPGIQGLAEAQEALKKLCIPSRLILIKVVAESQSDRLLDIAPNLEAIRTIGVLPDSCDSLNEFTEQICCILDGVSVA
jgi:hypothetical protein